MKKEKQKQKHNGKLVKVKSTKIRQKQPVPKKRGHSPGPPAAVKGTRTAASRHERKLVEKNSSKKELLGVIERNGIHLPKNTNKQQIAQAVVRTPEFSLAKKIAAGAGTLGAMGLMGIGAKHAHVKQKNRQKMREQMNHGDEGDRNQGDHVDRLLEGLSDEKSNQDDNGDGDMYVDARGEGDSNEGDNDRESMEYPVGESNSPSPQLTTVSTGRNQISSGLGSDLVNSESNSPPPQLTTVHGKGESPVYQVPNNSEIRKHWELGNIRLAKERLHTTESSDKMKEITGCLVGKDESKKSDAREMMKCIRKSVSVEHLPQHERMALLRLDSALGIYHGIRQFALSDLMQRQRSYLGPKISRIDSIRGMTKLSKSQTQSYDDPVSKDSRPKKLSKSQTQSYDNPVSKDSKPKKLSKSQIQSTVNITYILKKIQQSEQTDTMKQIVAQISPYNFVKKEDAKNMINLINRNREHSELSATESLYLKHLLGYIAQYHKTELAESNAASARFKASHDNIEFVQEKIMKLKKSDTLRRILDEISRYRWQDKADGKRMMEHINQNLQREGLSNDEKEHLHRLSKTIGQYHGVKST